MRAPPRPGGDARRMVFGSASGTGPSPNAGMPERESPSSAAARTRMVLDGRALARGCAARGTELRTAEQLCRAQLDRFLAALGDGRPVTVACTQEAPLFAAGGRGGGQHGAAGLRQCPRTGRLGEGRRRRRAEDGRAAGRRRRAAAARSRWCPCKSEGVTLVLGRDAGAIAAAERLADRLDLTVLLTGAEPVTPQPAPPNSPSCAAGRGPRRAGSAPSRWWWTAMRRPAPPPAPPMPGARRRTARRAAATSSST